MVNSARKLVRNKNVTLSIFTLNCHGNSYLNNMKQPRNSSIVVNLKLLSDGSRRGVVRADRTVPGRELIQCPPIGFGTVVSTQKSLVLNHIRQRPGVT